MGFKRALIVAFATMLGTSPAQAHHELGAAFLNDEIMIEGTVFEYEEGAARRVAWLDGRAPETSGNGQGPPPAGNGQRQGPPPAGHTGLGHSVARYVDDTLVVESDRLLSNLTGTEGNAVSDQHKVVETYRRADDEIGPALEMVLVVHDPGYLAEPWEMSWKKYYVADYNFTEQDCRLPFFAN